MRINADLYQLCSRRSGRVATSPSVHEQLRVCSQGISYSSCLTLPFTITAMLVAVLVAWAEPRRELRDCATCPVLIEVPAGTFVRMDKLGGPSFPVHFEKPYAIGKYEVTRAEFAAFVQATGHAAPGCTIWQSFGSRHDAKADWRMPGFEQASDEPVVCVSWHDAQSYITWLKEKTGAPYRLPNEAEWQYAARAGAGADGIYWLKAGLKRSGANCADCGGIGMMGREDLLSTTAVGTYAPNAFGLHDMMGNVAQWVADCANPSFAGAPRDGSAWLEGDCAKRMTRGGTWHSSWNELASYRKSMQADQRSNDTGFRVAKMLR